LGSNIVQIGGNFGPKGRQISPNCKLKLQESHFDLARGRKLMLSVRMRNPEMPEFCRVGFKMSRLAEMGKTLLNQSCCISANT
jgi:hypothetical protein